MSLYEQELDSARSGLNDRGHGEGDFTFAMVYLPPESDDGAMFTVRYEVVVTASAGAVSQSYVGGIGLRWVEDFLDDLDDGVFAR